MSNYCDRDLPGDPFLPPGVTERMIAEEGTHDLQRCEQCGKLKFAEQLDEDAGDLAYCNGCGRLKHAATLDSDGYCPRCLHEDDQAEADRSEPKETEPDADMGRMEHDDRGDA